MEKGNSLIYAVRNGRKIGLFSSQVECEAQVKNFPHAEYKVFNHEHEDDALMYLAGVNQ